MNRIFNRKQVIFAISIFAIFLIYLFIGKNYMTRKAELNFGVFNTVEIKGLLVYVNIVNKGVGFNIKNDSHTFVFYPLTDQNLNDSHIFNYFAKPGDSIFKAAYSDTLYLFKNDKVYRYTFQKSGEK